MLGPVEKAVESGTAGIAARSCARAPGWQGRNVRSAGQTGRLGTVPVGGIVPSAWLQTQRVANAAAGRITAALAARVHAVLGLAGSPSGLEWIAAGRTHAPAA